VLSTASSHYQLAAYKGSEFTRISHTILPAFKQLFHIISHSPFPTLKQLPNLFLILTYKNHSNSLKMHFQNILVQITSVLLVTQGLVHAQPGATASLEERAKDVPCDDISKYTVAVSYILPQ
jgi:hypothetical protein